MNPTIKRYLLSSVTTALTVGSLTLSSMLVAGPVEWTQAFWFTVLMTVGRAVWKAVVEGVAAQNADHPGL